MIARIGNGLLRRLPLLACLICAAIAPGVLAAPTDCVEDSPTGDGRFICFKQLPNPWGVGPCENTAVSCPSVQRTSAWCAKPIF
jgi:hypothetical protein